MTKSEKDFEELMQKLEEITTKLETDKLNLDELNYLKKECRFQRNVMRN